MTRYEYFEKWMTTDEWRTWKQLCVSRFRQIHTLNTRQARVKRREYLMQEVNFPNDAAATNDFDTMTNMYMLWSSTPQGHSHWNRLNSRTGPIR
jgi:hypothetical protein